jgi:hypothetical protein
MNPFEFVLGIILIGAVASVVKVYLGKERAPAQDGEADRLREDVRLMRERIAVLERIVTEKETALDREIEQLRDR